MSKRGGGCLSCLECLSSVEESSIGNWLSDIYDGTSSLLVTEEGAVALEAAESSLN